MNGLLIGGNNAIKGTIYSKLQRWVTGEKATHSFTFLPDYMFKQIILDARASVTLDFYSALLGNKDIELWIFKIPLTATQTAIIQQKIFEQFIGKSYGKLQIIWFAWRAINEIFHNDIRLHKNWFPNGTVCSEINWWTLKYASEYIPKIWDYIKYWNPDTFHSGDNKRVLYDMLNDGIIQLYYERYV